MKSRLKKSILMVLAVMMLLSNISFASSINVYVNDSKLKMQVPPVSQQGRTLVPLRSIFESMGAKVEWDQSTKTATGIKGDKEIVLKLGNKFATVNGKTVELDVPATAVNGATLVPARFIGETLGSNVNWDNNTRSVLVDSKLPFGKYKVNRVVDGDTIKINFNGKEESLRLIGVDTPESVHPDVLRNVPGGKLASAFTKSKLEGKEVAIEFDVQERDKYGRLLGYVWSDGEMFNKTLVKEGYAKVATYPPNVRYVDDFTKLQEQARNNKKGFWQGGEFGQPAPVKPQPKPQTKPVAPQGQGEFVITVSGSKYHRPGCRTVKQVKQKVSAKEAQDLGYTACKVCKP